MAQQEGGNKVHHHDICAIFMMSHFIIRSGIFEHILDLIKELGDSYGNLT